MTKRDSLIMHCKYRSLFINRKWNRQKLRLNLDLRSRAHWSGERHLYCVPIRSEMNFLFVEETGRTPALNASSLSLKTFLKLSKRSSMSTSSDANNLRTSLTSFTFDKISYTICCSPSVLRSLPFSAHAQMLWKLPKHILMIHTHSERSHLVKLPKTTERAPCTTKKPFCTDIAIQTSEATRNFRFTTLDE